ncbi:MAG: SHOCT-like domain-containing protein [Chloroflexia bacterium]
MSEERMQILRMLEAGQIKAREAAELLAALEKPKAEPEAPTRGRWLRVRVTDLKSGKPKVNVSVPLGLMEIALRMGARFVPKEVSLNPQELMEFVRSGHAGKIVDVEDEEDGERVEVYVE